MWSQIHLDRVRSVPRLQNSSIGTPASPHANSISYRGANNSKLASIRPHVPIPPINIGEIYVRSETGRVREVIIGRPVAKINYDPPKAPAIDLATRKTQSSGRFVTCEQAAKEFENFGNLLHHFGATVHTLPPEPGAYNQIFTRDIGIVIKNVLVLASMVHPGRQMETGVMRAILDASKGGFHKILYVDDPTAKIEGGDVIPHGPNIFVGISERTNYPGFKWIRKNFPEFQVIPMEIIPPTNDYETLHLDCGFNPIGRPHERACIIHPDSFMNKDDLRAFFRGWRAIEINRMEQDLLAANIYSIDTRNIIVRDKAVRVISELQKRHFIPHAMSFDAAASLGGLFRCGSLTIRRD